MTQNHARRVLIVNALPVRLQHISYYAGVWCVGSTAVRGRAPGRDIDLIVPPHYWSEWCRAALNKGPRDSPDPVPTRLGGWRWTEGGVQFDTWPDTLDALADRAVRDRGEFSGAVSLRTGLFLGPMP